MPILKTITAPNGAVVTFHKPGTAELSFRDGVAVVRMLSWVDQAAHDAGAGQVWSWPITLPIPDVADVEAAMVVSGVFAGGSIVADAAGGIAARRARHWALIKQQREAREYGGFDWDGSRFDSDPESQRRIQGAVQLAVMASENGQTFEITWVLADNTTRVLTGDDMVAVGAALGAHVSAVFAQGVDLRQQIAVAADPESIVWPA